MAVDMTIRLPNGVTLPKDWTGWKESNVVNAALIVLNVLRL